MLPIVNLETENILEKSIASIGTTKIKSALPSQNFLCICPPLSPPETGDDIPGLDYKELQGKSGKTFIFVKPHLEK